MALFHLFANPSNVWFQRIQLSSYIAYYIQSAAMYVLVEVYEDNLACTDMYFGMGRVF